MQVGIRRDPVIGFFSRSVGIRITRQIYGIWTRGDDDRGQRGDASLRARVGIEVPTEDQVIRGRHAGLDETPDFPRLHISLGRTAAGAEMDGYRPQILVTGDVDSRPDIVAIRHGAIVPLARGQDRITADNSIGNISRWLAKIGEPRAEIRIHPGAQVGRGVIQVVQFLDQGDVGIQPLEYPIAVSQIVVLAIPARRIRRHDADHLVR